MFVSDRLMCYRQMYGPSTVAAGQDHVDLMFVSFIYIYIMTVLAASLTRSLQNIHDYINK
jgi:hypothetical protein